MLVYASSLGLAADVRIEEVAAAVAEWLAGRSSFRGSGRDLLDFRERRLKDGSRLRAMSFGSGPDELWALRFSHPDREVHGRRWVVDLGVRRTPSGRSLECTVLTQTEEISARVTSGIVASRPGVVLAIAENCGLSSRTPGQRVHELTEDNAEAFAYGLDDPQRRHPYVILSTSADGRYGVDPERLRRLLIGLADIVVIAPGVDTFWLSRVLQRRYTPWGGAIVVIFAPTRQDAGQFVETRRLTPDDLTALAVEERPPEVELLSIITHRTNLPQSWRALKIEQVEQAAFRHEVQHKLAAAKASGDQTEYLHALEEDNSALQQQVLALHRSIDALNKDIVERDNTERRLRWELDQARRPPEDSHYETPMLSSTVTFPRELVAAVAEGKASLPQSLQFIAQLFPDRVTVLPSATKAAEHSEGFLHRAQAFDLLWTLSTEYWNALAGGKGDTEARAVFGSRYAATESERAASNPAGRKKRTFLYRGQPVVMLRHLKIGVKEDSLAETLRIHFHWDAAERRVVIGHCGAHLDFD